MNYRDVLCKIIPKDCRLGAEIGVHKGTTSEVLLKTFPNLTLWMVDPWGEWNSSINEHTRESQSDARLEACRRTSPFSDRAVITPSPSLVAAGIAPDDFDFVFIDAEHDYVSVSADLEAWWPKTKLVICHDYGNPQWNVAQAVHDFARAHDLEVHVEPGNIAWLS